MDFVLSQLSCGLISSDKYRRIRREATQLQCLCNGEASPKNVLAAPAVAGRAKKAMSVIPDCHPFPWVWDVSSISRDSSRPIDNSLFLARCSAVVRRERATVDVWPCGRGRKVCRVPHGQRRALRARKAYVAQTLTSHVCRAITIIAHFVSNFNKKNFETVDNFGLE